MRASGSAERRAQRRAQGRGLAVRGIASLLVIAFAAAGCASATSGQTTPQATGTLTTSSAATPAPGSGSPTSSPLSSAKPDARTPATLPDGQYFGDVEALDVAGSGGGHIVFNPFTWAMGATPVDNKPDVWASVPFTADATAEYSVGADAASSHVVDTTFDAAFGKLVETSLSSYKASPALGYEITIESGELTFIKQISAITPTSPDANFVEP